jgi:hypothetical protein
MKQNQLTEPPNSLTFYHKLALKSFLEHLNPCSTNSTTQRHLTHSLQRLGYLCPKNGSNIQLKSSLASPGDFAYANIILTYCDQAAAMVGYIDPNCEIDRSVT